MSAYADADILAELHAELVRAELRAARTALPTPDADAVIRGITESGRKLAIVSNNSVQAVRDYLAVHQLEVYVSAISARTSGDPTLMKPNRYLLEAALFDLDVSASDAIFVGDSVTDVEASIAAGMPCIGYANKPGKANRLAAAGAVEIIDSMTAILEGERTRE
jgi:phosphoglycolate phosphatase